MTQQCRLSFVWWCVFATFQIGCSNSQNLYFFQKNLDALRDYEPILFKRKKNWWTLFNYNIRQTSTVTILSSPLNLLFNATEWAQDLCSYLNLSVKIVRGVIFHFGHEGVSCTRSFLINERETLSYWTE